MLSILGSLPYVDSCGGIIATCHLGQDASCPMCLVDSEIILHLLPDCMYS